MQVRKVAVLATGALATAAAMGSTPAFAADGEGSPEVAPATVGTLQYEGKHRASDEAMRQLAEQWMAVAPEQTWSTSVPWEQEQPQILSVGSGSAVSLAPLQQCASDGPFLIGATAPQASPNTVLGSCRNGYVAANGGGGGDAMLSVLDNSAISALAYQQCGSVGAAGVGVPVASPSTVAGNCDNGAFMVSEPADEEPSDPYESRPEGTEQAGATAAPEQVTMVGSSLEQDEVQVLSAGSGTGASLAALQQCASGGPFLVGAGAPQASPNTVLGGCNNGYLDIHGEPSDAMYSLFDNAGLSAASVQQCGSVGAAGVGVPVASPSTVGRDCDNGGVIVG